MRSFQTVLLIAKKKYAEAIRGRDYQVELLDKMTKDIDKFNSKDWNTFIERKKMFTTEIALLEDVFGTELLQLEHLERLEN